MSYLDVLRERALDGLGVAALWVARLTGADKPDPDDTPDTPED